MNAHAEIELVARANAGDEAAFATLFREHSQAMKLTAARLFHRLQLYPVWQLSEDATQDAWLRQPLRRFDGSRWSLRSLLCAQTRRAAIDLARKLVGKKLIPRIEREATGLADVLPVPARTPQQDARLELSLLFGGCKVYIPKQEKLVLQRWMEDEPIPATCRRLRLSQSRIFQLRTSAVDRVRQAYELEKTA